MNRWCAGAVALCCLLLAACASPPPPPPDTRAADAKAIRDMEAQVGKLYAAKDLDQIMAGYAEDASSLMPNAPTTTGKDAIRGAVGQLLADPALALEIATAKVEVARSGDLAYSQGTYTYKFTDPKTKRVLSQPGKYVEVYKKQADGSWKIVEDTAIPDGPATLVKSGGPARAKGKARGKKSKRKEN